MLVHHKAYKPAFGIEGHRDQYPLAVHTVLSINEPVGDCAAYEGIGPANAGAPLLEAIRGGGNKISESEARQLFPEIEAKNLRYRR